MPVTPLPENIGKPLPSGVGLQPVAPEDAIKYFGSKVVMSKADYMALVEEVRSIAFTVSRVSKMEMITDAYNLVNDAIKSGISTGEFVKQFDALYDSKGWDTLDRWHTELILNQNASTAYSVGRYEQMAGSEKEFPWWGFSVVGQGSTDICLQLQGKVYPAGHAVFRTFWPPNHFGCRTSVYPISKYDSPGPISYDIPPIKPPDGFGSNPGVIEYEPDVSDFPKELKKDFAADIE